MFAKDADIEGKVTATSGSISNCTVGNLTANGNIYMGGNTLQFGTSSALNISGGSLRVSGTPFVMGAGASVFEFLNMMAGSNLSVGGTMSFGDKPVAKYDSGTATADTYYMLNGSAINSLKASSGGINMVNDTPTGSNKNIVSYDPTTGTFYYTLASVNSIYGAIPTVSGYNGTITVPRGTSGSLELNFSKGLLTGIG